MRVSGKWAGLVGAVILGLTVSGASIAHANGSTDSATPAWVQRSLEYQFRLGDTLPLRTSAWVGTHNSYNSIAEVGLALSPFDPNQTQTITQQLDSGVRQLELDVHWFPSLANPLGALAAQNFSAPVVCHSLPSNIGCTTEKTLGPILSEILAWSNAHPRDVLLVYLEDHLTNQLGYQTTGALIAKTLGSLVYRTPSATACSPMPMSVTRDQILSTAARILMVANSCGVGADPAWKSSVFDWSSSHVEAQVQNGFQGWPKCGPDFTSAQYSTTFTRYYEEMGRVSTLDHAGGWPITSSDLVGMTQCGVNLISLDN